MYLPKIHGALSSAAFLLLAATAPAVAADRSATQSGETAVAEGNEASAQTAKAEKPKKICRTYKLTQSRVGAKRICMTREEWNRAKFD